MLTAYFHDLVAFVAQHHNWAGVVTFLAALVEGIVVIGSFVPGATLIVALAALIAYGGEPWWPLILWAAAGAFLGDASAYWLGLAHGGRVRGMWPFATRPQLISGGEAFFRRHGGWSVLIGRFVPPARAVVPVVAGLMGMAPLRYLTASAFTALTWGTSHVLTGLIASYALAGLGTVSRRLVVAVVIFAIGLVVVIALVRIAIGLGLRAMPAVTEATLAWARGRRDPLAHLVMRILAPEHHEFRFFALISAVLIAAFAGFARLVDAVASEKVVLGFDHAVSQSLQLLRTGWTDDVMVIPTLLGDWQVTTAVALAALAVLLLHRRWRLAGGMAAALLATLVFMRAMKLLVQTTRPADLYSGIDSFSFPSGHATMTATLYGIIGLIAFRGLGGMASRIVMGLCAGFIAAVALSRVYLAAHWPSDVGAGVLFGVGMTAGFALIFRREEISERIASGVLAAAATALVVVGAWHVDLGFERALAFYAPQPVPPLDLARAWRDGGWRRLPPYRVDMAGEREEPLVLQWRGSPGALTEDLSRLGWSPPVPWSLTSINRFAFAHEDAASLPVLPRLDEGAHETVTMIKPSILHGVAGRYVLRAWPRRIREPDGQVETILSASVAFERVEHPFGQLSLPVDVARPGCDAGPLIAGLKGEQVVGKLLAAADGGCKARLTLAGTS